MKSECKLLVLEGAHTGVEVALDDGTYLLGTDLGCDLVLLDPGVAGQHMRLHVENSRVNVERLADMPVIRHGKVINDVMFSVANGDLLQLGQALLRIYCSDAAIDVIADESPILEIPSDMALPNNQQEAPIATSKEIPTLQQMSKMQGQPKSRMLWVLPLLVILVGAGGFFASRALLASPPLRQAASFSVPATITQKQERDELIARVREFLGDDGLDVQRDKQGRIVVSGTTKAALVQQELKELKNEFKDAIEIVDQVTYVTDNKPGNRLRLPQHIMNVHVGAANWFQTANGVRYFEGSVMEDGAEVVGIGMDRIVFKRSGRLAVFELDDGRQKNE